jgi:acetyl/propionyl-CoA carboxylase alpha subunit
MTPKTAKTAEPIPLDQFKILIICRGPIAMEAMEVAHEIGIPKPDIVVSKREVFESVEGRAPWSEHDELYDKLHIIDDYKNQDQIIDIALKHGIKGIYVGYGYSAENSEFVRRCENEGLIPLAPPSSVMEFSASKFRAKKHVGEKLGIPVLPGSDAAAALATKKGISDEKLIAGVVAEVEKILTQNPGQIIRLKAVASGGGKGQRLVTEVSQAAPAVKEIWAEVGARGIDGDKGVLVEMNLAHPRHWEIQVLSDGETVVHFGGRECSIQNVGSQKFVEVSLHPGQYDHYLAELNPKKDATLIKLLKEEQRRIQQTCDHAVRIIQSLGYRGAATVEFLVAEDGGRQIFGKPHFMEINSRIQVEHRVSEAISKVKGQEVRLVGEQIRIGAGQKLGYTQKDIEFEGYAFEARINASNPNFLIGASGSEVEIYDIPEPGETFFYDDGGAASLFADKKRFRWAIPNFDSNFGLAVFRGKTQREALDHAHELLLRFHIAGNDQLMTTRSFHLGVVSLLRAAEPYGKVRTDFSEIYLAFAARVYHALARIRTSSIAGDDPLRRLLLRMLERFQEEPSLAIAFAYRAKILDGKNPNRATDLLREMPALIQFRFFDEESAAIEELGKTLPPVVQQVLDAVASSEIFEFTREKDSLEYNIPESVSVSRARRILIDELRDATIDSVAPRPLAPREVDDLRGILDDLEARIQDRVERESALAPKLSEGLANCRGPLKASQGLSPSDFRVFNDELRALKWSIRKGELPGEVETLLMFEVNRAVRVVRGPNVVAQLAGTIFLKPSPDKPHYVEVGQEVVEDETVVALLENMKMFNEIRAHMSGKIKQIMVENERPVLPGQVLMVIE